MEYMNVVRDFAQRTLDNLNFIQSTKRSKSPVEIYEVTQLMNSLLGLLVFPQQRYIDSIPQLPLEELKKCGWPIPRVVGDYPQASDLRKLIRYLRNSIAHFNIEFISDEKHELHGLQVWNFDPRIKETTWKASITVEEIEMLARRFVELLLES